MTVPSGKKERKYISLDEARKNKPKLDWTKVKIKKPNNHGVTVLSDYRIESLFDYIDWTPFFRTWEIRGKFPAVLDDPAVQIEAGKIYQDAVDMLKSIAQRGLIRANGVVGLFPANSNAFDDIEIYEDDERKRMLGKLHTLRRQTESAEYGKPNLALADFIAPRESGVKDYIGAFALTAGIGVEELVRKYKKNHDDYSVILVKSLSDRLAEAFAEHIHERVRREFWGYSPGENNTNDDLIREKFRGIRPAPGYPAQPDHTEKRIIFDLLKVEENAGITLTESYVMNPTASVCGLYFAHPDAVYFKVGRIGKDQVMDYCQRKGIETEEGEKWLHPILNYKG